MTPEAMAETTFEEIREKLDPAYGYLVFEIDPCAAEVNLPALAAFLGKAPQGLCQLQAVTDRVTEKSLLVAKLEPGRAEMMKERILETGLPPNVAVYFYAAWKPRSLEPEQS